MLRALVDGSASIVLAPVLPWVWLGPLFAPAALVFLAALVRRAAGTGWRVLSMVALILAALNPSLVVERRQPIRDVATIVVDRSPSQSIGDRTGQTDRALADLRRKLDAFDDLETRIVDASDPAAESGPVNETRLFDAVSRALADVPRRRVAGVFLITDGQVHDIPAKADKFAELGPIHALITGERDEGDRRLTLLAAPTYGIVGKPAQLTIRVDDLPDRQSAEAGLTMRVDGGDPRRLRLPVGRDVHVEMTVAHGGQNVLELEVDAAPRETTLVNNRAAVVINGVRDRLKVLLVSGEPHAGERTWRNLLKADPGVDLVHFTILRPPDKQDETPIRELSLISFPVRELFEEKLNEFDLIIFDRWVGGDILSDVYLDNIARYVEAGGALLEASGESLAGTDSLFRTPLGAVLPGEPTGRVLIKPFRPLVSKDGLRHPVTADLPRGADDGPPSWGRWFRQVEVKPGPETSTLMEGADGAPLLILSRVGKGRVAQLTSDQIWLWSRGFEGGGPQAELLRRLAHWLMREPELEENDLRARADDNRVVVERRSVRPDARPITVVTPSDKTLNPSMIETRPGLERASIPAREPGIYRVSDGVRSALAVVGTVNPPELADVRSTEEKLAPVAAASGGRVVRLADAGVPEIRRVPPDAPRFGRDWLGARANGDHIVTGVVDTPLLPAGLVLVFALGALMAAWRREGR